MAEDEIHSAYYTYIDSKGELRYISDDFLQAIRDLRKNQTSAEKLLWECIRNRKLGGYKFRRQFPIMGYIVDFYCRDCCLAIEVDGSIHNEPEVADYDSERQKQLESIGVKVIRFTNDEVYDDIENVLKTIYNKLAS